MAKEYSKEVKDRNIFIAVVFCMVYNFIFVIVDVWMIVLLEICGITFLLIYLKKMEEINIKDLLRNKNIKYIIFGYIMLRIIAISFSNLGNEVYGEMSFNDSYHLNRYYSGLRGAELLEFFIQKDFLAPIREEFTYRYVIIGNIGEMNKKSVVISSIICSLIHQPMNIIYFTMYFLMGLVLSIIYYKSKRIDICIAIHILNNTWILP